jgi:hypothetical protein
MIDCTSSNRDARRPGDEEERLTLSECRGTIAGEPPALGEAEPKPVGLHEPCKASSGFNPHTVQKIFAIFHWIAVQSIPDNFTQCHILSFSVRNRLASGSQGLYSRGVADH